MGDGGEVFGYTLFWSVGGCEGWEAEEMDLVSLWWKFCHSTEDACRFLLERDSALFRDLPGQHQKSKISHLVRLAARRPDIRSRAFHTENKPDNERVPGPPLLDCCPP